MPIVEIPYAKYLDCGADMFFEAVIAAWLSNGQKPNGMIIRLQGFDRGISVLYYTCIIYVYYTIRVLYYT